jgi:hypothetical protein
MNVTIVFKSKIINGTNIYDFEPLMIDTITKMGNVLAHTHPISVPFKRTVPNFLKLIFYFNT